MSYGYDWYGYVLKDIQLDIEHTVIALKYKQ